MGGCVGVVGGSEATRDELATAGEVGRLLAVEGAVLVCGGLGGVMEAACRGAWEAGGVTVGLLPGDNPVAGNPYLTVTLTTGLGELRNGLIVRSVDALIGIGGGWGTLSELALAQRTGKPAYLLGSWDAVLDPVGGRHALGIQVQRPDEAVRQALAHRRRP